MMEPPGVFTTPTIACPSCHHGIDPHGTNPGGPCDVGTYVHDGEEVSLCQCMWSPNDIAARLIAAARNDERDELAKKYGKGFLNLYQHCSCAQGMTYPGCPVHSKDWERWIRADERERWGLGWIAAADNVAALAHAEAVAARLVEVVCEQNLYLAIADSRLERVQRQRNIAWNERDAARAEVATLTDALDIAKDERYAARVEQARAAQRLRDLRAKVEGMRDGALEGFRSQPHRSHLGTMASTLERVLVLIEEAERG